MKLLGRFIEMVEASGAAGATPEQVAALPGLRALQRMGEDVADDQLPRLAELQARLEREFAQIAPAGAMPLAPTVTAPTEPRDAAHG
jgi:hypothetical protein